MQPSDLDRTLIVSCQPVPGGPMDSAPMVVGFARAALAAGAAALRIESVAYVAAVRAATHAPIIGIVKRDLDDSPVRITPYLADVEGLVAAGADIVAFDATRRTRPVPVAELIAAIHAAGRLAMADCSDIEDARAALAAGADFIGSTLSGYVGADEPTEPDLALVRAMRALSPNVIAEGRIRTPEQAAAAVRDGASAVVVGSAITRTEHATAWFRDAVAAANDAVSAAGRPVLAIDIGGTKILAALVSGQSVTEPIQLPTPGDRNPDAWIAAIAKATRDWRGRYDRVGIAVTGRIEAGCWHALNPATLGIPDGFPLLERLEAAFGVRAFGANDAQAAAWGEYRFGAGGGEDLVFLTISTGIGGGVVLNGKPMLGLAGHFGQWRGHGAGDAPLEDVVSGRWIAAEARRAGHEADAASVFAAAASGAPWASEIVAASAARVALLCQDIQFGLDPARIVIGGGIGLAPGYLDAVRAALPPLAARLAPKLVPARLGAHAGIVGVADLSVTAS